MRLKVFLLAICLYNAIIASDSRYVNYKWMKRFSTIGRVRTFQNILEGRCLRGGKTSSKNSSTSGPCIGIDLGTTYSCVGVWKNGRVEICPNDQGNRITPSYVAWDSDGQRIVGDAAKNQAASNPVNTIFDIKRLIGRKFTDPTVQRDAKLLPYKSKT